MNSSQTDSDEAAEPGFDKLAAETEYLTSIGTCPDAAEIARPLAAALMGMDDLWNRIGALEFPASFHDERSQPWRVEARRTVIEVRRAIDIVSSVARISCYPEAGHAERVESSMRHVLEALTGISRLSAQVYFDEMWEAKHD